MSALVSFYFLVGIVGIAWLGRRLEGRAHLGFLLFLLMFDGVHVGGWSL
jgi:hypothetical protein